MNVFFLIFFVFIVIILLIIYYYYCLLLIFLKTCFFAFKERGGVKLQVREEKRRSV